MKTFEFEIIETLVRIVKIEAANAEDAQEQLKNAYENEDIVLDANDWLETQINPEEGEPLNFGGHLIN